MLTSSWESSAITTMYARLDDGFQHEIVILFCDLDGFKAINDEQGRDAGDAALQVVAHVMKQGCRNSDHLSRLGGGQFAVLAALVAAGLLGTVLLALFAKLRRGGLVKSVRGPGGSESVKQGVALAACLVPARRASAVANGATARQVCRGAYRSSRTSSRAARPAGSAKTATPSSSPTFCRIPFGS